MRADQMREARTAVRLRREPGGLVLLSALLTALAGTTLAQSLPDAFAQGSAFGRGGNAAARATLTPGSAAAVLPATPTPSPGNTPDALFRSPGLSQPATARATECASSTPGNAAPGTADPVCGAIEFSQRNAYRRPRLGIGMNDPLLSRAREISADPQAVAGSLAGTYSACQVQTTTDPPRVETAICHQYRTSEPATCDRVLIVTPVVRPGCTDGQPLTRVSADPCPDCMDKLVFAFSCGAGGYRMHLSTILRDTGTVYADLGTLDVPGRPGIEIARTPGLGNFQGQSCYQTYYSQSCTGTQCRIGVWFENPCQGTAYQGESLFETPTVTEFEDRWDNQCAALEARSR